MLQPINDDCRVFGYVRVSKGKDGVLKKIPKNYVPPEDPNDPSTKRQIAALTEWAEKRDKTITIECDEGISGAEVPYKERPGFQKLVKKMREKDRLVIWRLDRLDRGLGRIVEAARWLVEEKKIHLHTLYEQNGEAIDLDTTQGKIMLQVYSMVATIGNDSLRAAITAGLHYCKYMGLRYCRHPGYGRRFEPVMEGNEQVYTKAGKPMQYIVWDEDECDVIREIVRRRDEDHESWYRIGLTLHNRGAQSPEGGQWLTWSEHTLAINDQGNPYRVKKVYAWYKALLDHGMDLGQPGVPAGIGTLAKQFGISVETVKAYINPTKAKTLKKNYLNSDGSTRRRYTQAMALYDEDVEDIEGYRRKR